MACDRVSRLWRVLAAHRFPVAMATAQLPLFIRGRHPRPGVTEEAAVPFLPTERRLRLLVTGGSIPPQPGEAFARFCRRKSIGRKRDPARHRQDALRNR